MRGPILAGVLAGFLVVLVGLSAFVALALGRPEPALSTPTPEPTLAAVSPDVSPTPTTAASEPASAEPTISTPRPSLDASPIPSEEVGLAVGDRAPALRLPALGGSEIDTSVLEGRALWINFMATWCPPCIDELPMLERFQGQLEEEMTVLVVDIGESEGTVMAFMDSLGIDLPVGLDTDGTAQRTWGAYALPVHYWIDADGRVGGFLYGGAGPEQFIEGVHSVLPDAELEP
jgi:thiol-disulfide isomerase/thioredoxin